MRKVGFAFLLQNETTRVTGGQKKPLGEAGGGADFLAAAGSHATETARRLHRPRVLRTTLVGTYSARVCNVSETAAPASIHGELRPLGRGSPRGHAAGRTLDLGPRSSQREPRAGASKLAAAPKERSVRVRGKFCSPGAALRLI